MLGENSLEVATTWLNLGGVLRAAGKLEEAESACRQCLDIRERQLGSQHTDTAAAQIGQHFLACSILLCHDTRGESRPLFDRHIVGQESVTQAKLMGRCCHLDDNGQVVRPQQATENW